MKQESTNFKDYAVQFYGGDIFKKYRDLVEEVFVSMPPPPPSRVQTNMHRNHMSAYRGSSYSTAPSTSSSSTLLSVPVPVPVNMSRYMNRSAGCIAPHCLVKMNGNLTSKYVSQIVPGDILSCGFVVKYVLKFKVENYQMVHLPTGLLISPYHPVKHCDISPEWEFPRNLRETELYNGDYVYNFILNTGHVMIINDVSVITLGHGYDNIDILKHDYLGTNVVIEDIEAIGSDTEGYVNINEIERGPEGKITKFKFNQNTN
jgi:hypothetical protein